MDQLKVNSQLTNQETERVEKPLTRGLAEISRVFAAAKTTEPPDRNEAAPPSYPRTVLLRPSTVLNRGVLASMIKELQEGLEERLRVIDTSVSCYPAGEVDLLAVDRENQLAIIDFDTASNDALLLRGLSHYNWIRHNLSNLERMYSQHTINLLAQPRVFLLAPRFSVLLTNAVRHMVQPRIHCVRFQVVEGTSGTLGMLFENAVDE